ncbi:MAG: EamA family transporter [Fimbriimonadaceae bacterium]|nr:EamA family transporter [Fimbriimonadaceae bacterium]
MSRKLEPGLVPALAAIGLWSTSAAVTGTAVNNNPPITYLATGFSIAALVGLTNEARRGRLRASLTAPPAVYALGFYGMASYHVAYYLAFSMAPPVQVNLLNHLWPLLTVLLSAPVLRQPWPRGVLPAACCALCGAWLVVTGGHWPQLSAEHTRAYLLALWCAVTWAMFNNLLRKLGPPAGGRMPLYCLQTAIVAWILVAVTGSGPLHLSGWLAATYSGCGTLFAAFRFWDKATQTGNMARIGLLSYLILPNSTLLLAALGYPLPLAAVLGMVLILGAALVAVRSRGREELAAAD